jgi:beta-phosphoglucomutase family hydrolase
MHQKLSFEAVVFDLDGVITKTALVHARAWKRMFDEYLKMREAKYGERFVEFTHSRDYLPYVDGKPRYNGVASFLGSRGIKIPFGLPSDNPETESCCGLGNRKNELFNDVLAEEGVEIYSSTVALIKQLKEAGVRLGVASSSKNCKQVLEAVGLIAYFETFVDGIVSANLGLNGKPEPDIFLKACEILGVSNQKTIVVEDAVSGVQAGGRGNFGLVLGIARENNRQELLENGANVVVEDLSEINGLDNLNKLFLENYKKKYKL